jgi:hypothetical protein
MKDAISDLRWVARRVPDARLRRIAALRFVCIRFPMSIALAAPIGCLTTIGRSQQSTAILG